MKTPSIRGLTLVELMVALGVLGILLSVVAPSFADMLNRRRVAAVAAELSTDIAFARAETGLRPDQAVTIYFKKIGSMSCYTMAYQGGAGYCDCTLAPGSACTGSQIPEIKTTQVASTIGVSFDAAGTPSRAFNLPAADRVTFAWPQLMAQPNDFSVTVTGVRGSSLRVQVNGMGRVAICSPGGTFSGYTSC